MPALPTAASLEGRRVPDVSLKVRRAGQWHALRTGALFEGRQVVAFALPGAFTPTCSGSHLPRFDELAPTFQAHGIDDVLCLPSSTLPASKCLIRQESTVNPQTTS